MQIASTYYGRYNVRIAFATDVLGSTVVTGAISEIVTTDLDANRALISDASGKIITSSTVTSTELSYIAGVTSSVQTQLNAKEGTLTKGNLTEATSSVLTITGGTGAIIGSGVTIEIDQADSSNDGYLSSSDWSTFNAKLGISLTDTYIFVGNGSNEATGVAVSGDITMANDGTVAIASGVIVDADINASAAITRTKLAAGTAYRILVNDGSGVISENAAITASRAVVSDSNGQLTASSVTTTELGYSSGVTSAIQTQLDELIVGLNTSATVKTPTASQHLYALIWDNTNNQWDLQATGSGGSLTGPGSSTDNAIVRWDGTGGTAAQNSGILIDDSDNITDVTSITLDLNGLHLLDTDASHDLIVAVGSDLTADRTLTVITGDSDRTITLSGSPTLGDWFDQSVKAADSVVFSDLTLSNLGGLHILDTDSSHDLIVTTSSNLTADRTLTLVPGDANRTLTINASGTVYVTGGTDVALADGGTGASLTDPNADRIMFWDDSAGAVTWLTVGTGLSITATTLEATGGGISGLTTNRIPFATSSTTLGDDGSLHWDNTNKLLTIGDTNGLTFFADWNTSTSNRDNLILSDGMADWSNVSGLDNFGVGSGALHGLTAGSHNHAIGAGAGAVITSGEHNELIGRIAGSSLTIGSNNVIIGAYSDVSSGASGNVLLGYNQQGPTTGGQHVLIGYNVESVHPTANGELSIQNAIFGVGNTAGTTSISTGNIGMYVQSPTARLHLPAGAAAAGNAPLKLTTGTALTTPEDGAIEYHASHLYFTIGATRYQLDQQGGGGGALSALTAATGINTINNVGYAQEWQWNSLAGAVGLKLSSTSTAAASNAQALLEVNLSGANATSTQTTYSGRFVNTHTGTASTNVAGYFSASGGTNNYAGIFASGKVGIGLIAPTAKLQVKGDGTTTGSLFLLEDSGGTDRVSILDNGSAEFVTNYNTTAPLYYLYNTPGSYNAAATNGAFMRLSYDQRASTGSGNNNGVIDAQVFYYNGGSAASSNNYVYRASGNLSTMLGSAQIFSSTVTRSSTSGSGGHIGLSLQDTYNFTGTYIGDVYGIYYNPTLTSMTGVTHYSFKATSGLMELPASATAGATFRIPHGSAPTAPVDGDIWTTSAGLYVRINGSTIGPLS